jgi:NADPH:quinone reductase-like Zn-dependent oxidoreductase
MTMTDETTTHRPLPTTTATTMSAFVQDEYGRDPDAVLRPAEVDRPTIGRTDVLVGVRAASIDQGTWHVMTGEPLLMRVAGFGVRRPRSLNPGRAFAGIVEAVGDEVDDLVPGDAVFGTADGTFAAYVAAPSGQVARMPANLSFEEASALPISGVTALQAVRDAGEVAPGRSVLVIGASGGVGTSAVQIAKAYGADVTAVVSTANLDQARALGADHVVDYTQEDVTDGATRYDVVLDVAGGRRLSRLRRTVEERGTLVLVGGEFTGRWAGGVGRIVGAKLLAPFARQRLRSLLSSENAADRDVHRGLVEAGPVKPVVEAVYPFERTIDALRDQFAGSARGKRVITVDTGRDA